MQKLSLDALVSEHLERAAAAAGGRSATTLHGGRGHALRQTLLALTAGASLAEHENPGEATLLVLRGRVRLTSGGAEQEGRTGDLVVIPPARHALEALEDAAVLLTVAAREREQEGEAPPGRPVFDLHHVRGILSGSIGGGAAPCGRLAGLLGRVLMLRASRREDRKRVPQYSSS